MVESVHFLIPSGDDDGWDDMAPGPRQAFRHAGLGGDAHQESMSGGGGKAIAHSIKTADRQHDDLMVRSTPLVLRPPSRQAPPLFGDAMPIGGMIGDDAARAVPSGGAAATWKGLVVALDANARGVAAVVLAPRVSTGRDRLFEPTVAAASSQRPPPARGSTVSRGLRPGAAPRPRRPRRAPSTLCQDHALTLPQAR